MNKDFYTTELPMKQVVIKDNFWDLYLELARTKMIPYQWEALNDRILDAEPSHCIKNYKIAAGLLEGDFGGYPFQDSDLSKWIEAAAYSLIQFPDNALEQTIDSAIDLIVSAQQPDGYLDTYYIINGLENRWTELVHNHELYCAGHMLEAAIAYYQTTGKHKLLDAMLRFIDHIDSIFGASNGKKKGYPGHEVLEMALMRLYEVTKDEKHLNLAKYFIDERGQKPLYFESEVKALGQDTPWKESSFGYQYYQAGLPVREQDKAEGHAVRAVYLYSGMADVARETGDVSLYDACLRLWDNLVHKRMYITGAIGSSSYGEAFTFDYDLPNDTIYGETCASIGLLFFAHRMLLITPKAEYADVMEKVLYNGTISGMSLDGTKFFYVNPLEVVPKACEKDQLRRHVKPERQKWFGCACCPPNLARMITSLSNYIYTEKADTLYVHLYVGNESTVTINGIRTDLKMTSEYPWNGDISLSISPEKAVEGTIAFRIPGWCIDYEIQKNDVIYPSSETILTDGYLYLNGQWNADDMIRLHFEMPVQVICANPMVRENLGKVAVMRGPIVYCLEEEDNGSYLQQICLPKAPNFTYRFEKDLLGGVVALQSDGYVLQNKNWDNNSLYHVYTGNSYTPKDLIWIPYYAWANRSLGEMSVW
ncbi:MAG: beta-L-arabinofuranosidase domain-containing protein, partial [Mobilitalea sp.]